MATRALPLLPGYETLERLGRGAGALICLARDLSSRRLVAIKHVVRHDEEDEKFIAQAESEYEVARQLNQPYLRKCYDIVRVRKWLKTRELFLIMEYVDGERLEDARPDSLRRVLAIFRQVAQGLHALHGHGFAHADIKPNNVLLTRDEQIKIIDFGQSCPLGTIKQRVQGTPDYIAPEQVHRKEIDQRTDVFNLGATMYWVLTGKYFKTLIQAAPTAARKTVIEAARGNEPPHVLSERVPVPLSNLVMQCCETAKELRPRDMREVLSRLDLVEHMDEVKQRIHARAHGSRQKRTSSGSGSHHGGGHGEAGTPSGKPPGR